MTFVEHKYSPKQIKALFTNADKDLGRAKRYDEPEVRFHYSYNALLKLSIAVCASLGLRVLSRAGHHKELLDKAAEVLRENKINDFGNQMRKNRNKEMYGGGVEISEKQADEALEFVKSIFIMAEEDLNKKRGRVKFDL